MTLSLVLGLISQAPIAGILLGKKTVGQFELTLVYAIVAMVGFHWPIRMKAYRTDVGPNRIK